MDIVLPLLTLAIGVLLGVLGSLLGTAYVGRRGGVADVGRVQQQVQDTALIRDGLDRLHDRMRDLEHQRVSWQSTLHQQVDEVRHSTDVLRRETSALATALRKPHVRGQWGELHLRRSVELAGMVDHCDFSEQLHLTAADGAQRPDVVVHLAGGKSVVVDAKVPVAAYLEALADDDPEEERAHLVRHARQVRSHVDQLSAKSYWRALDQSPEFVVLFMPAESFLSAALEADSGLLEYAASRNVVLATPTTLIALLRTIAYGWTTETLAERTREIHELGRELYARLGTVGRHLDKLGRSLKGSIDAYNSAIGSLETRVFVTARHFADVADLDQRIEPVQPVEDAPRALTAAELLDAVAEQRPELPDAGPTGVAPLRRRAADLP
jgi:DNA recombination protein RmuC